jgi:SSS family solute:Na+ symporter
MLIFLALLTYQGMIMLFPVVMLGLYWRRANKEGALAGFLGGTTLSFVLTIVNPRFSRATSGQPACTASSWQRWSWLPPAS